MELVHNIEKLCENEYLLLGKGTGIYNILRLEGSEITFEKIAIKGTAFDNKGSEFSMNTALLHTID